MADPAISTSLTDHFGECDGCGCPLLEELHDGRSGEPVELVCTSCGMGYVAFMPRTDEAVADPATAEAA